MNDTVDCTCPLSRVIDSGVFNCPLNTAEFATGATNSLRRWDWDSQDQNTFAIELVVTALKGGAPIIDWEPVSQETSHTRAVPSTLAVATRVPSELTPPH